MFTGIVERTATILSIVQHQGFDRLQIGIPQEAHWTDIRDGQSIAVNGVCLTIAAIATTAISFDVIPETLAKTNLRLLAVGESVNLERAVRVGDRIDGHFVQGHVDGVATILELKTTEDEVRIVAQAPADLAQYLIPKGSVCLDGVSLTIAAVDGPTFEVALIPTTLNMTNLRDRRAGWPLNFEADIFSKTIINWLERRQSWVEDQTKGRM